MNIRTIALIGFFVAVPSLANRESAEGDLKEFAFMNCTESIIELQLKYQDEGKIDAHLPKKNADNPNFFTLTTEYANLENAVLVIKVNGAIRPYTVFKGTYGNGLRNQSKSQITPGRYKIMADPYRTDKSLLLVDINTISKNTFPCLPNIQMTK